MKEEKVKRKIKIKKRLSPFQIIVLGFVGLVLIGTLLLMLPFSSTASGFASFQDALFTATSAVCVTGLVVKDTATYWTWFGQLIILILIQIGGLGVVTVVVGFAMRFGRKIGLMQRNTMQAAISAPQVGGIMRLTNFIIRTTLIIELIGAICLAPTMIMEFGFFGGVWRAIFTSISAFCNAGFDLMGTREQFSSLVLFNSNIVVNTVIMLLIIIGGLGFSTWDDIRTNKLRIKRYRMQSRVILTMVFWLIFIPAVFFYFYEFSRPVWSEFSVLDKILASLFQAVTPRTAGFNTVSLSDMSETSLIVIIVLMLIGGAPGSTAGGMKTTTIAVLIATTASVFRRRSDANCYGRRIADDTVKNASTILMMYLILFFVSSVAIGAIEGLSMMECMFEVASAIGTVGLTLGITTSLSIYSKLILIFLMFFGRVGGLTLIFATSGNKQDGARLPAESINVG